MAIEKLFGQSIFWRSIYFATAFITNILLSRYLQAALSGSVLYLASIFSFISLLLGLSLDSGFTFFASRKLAAYNQLVSFAVVWIALITLSGIITSCFFLSYFLKGSPVSLNGYQLYGYFYIAGLMFTSFLSALFYSRSNFWLPNLIFSVVNIFVIIAIPLLGHYYPQNSTLIIDVYFYSTFLQGILLVPAFVIFNKKENSNSYFPSAGNIKQLIRFSVMALGANIIFFLINRVDFFFVEKYCTANQLGNYIMVSRLGQMLLFFPQVLASVIFPQAAGNTNMATIAESTLITGRLLSRIYLLMFIVLLLAGKWLFPFMFGPTFTSMYILMLIFLPGFFALSNLAVISAFLLGNGHLKINITGTLLALIIVVGGDMLVVERFGVFAAAAVSTLAYTCNFIYSVVRFNRKYNIAFIDLFKWQKKDLQWVKQIVKKPVQVLK